LVGVVAPGADGAADFLEEGFGGVGFEPEVGGDFEGEVEAEGVIGFGDVETQAGAVGRGIEVVGGGKAPTVVGEEEAVVAEVVVVAELLWFAPADGGFLRDACRVLG
jgi:hypothetical protein